MKYTFYSLWLLPFLLILSKGETSTVAPKNYALFFAAKDYQEWSSLRNPISDAEAVAQKLEKEFGFTTEIVRNPTKLQIQLKLNDYLTRDFKQEDQLLIFFTGHGEFNKLTNQGYFIPVDGKKNDPFHGSHLSLNMLKPTISSIDCEHILLAIDACYSGSIDEELVMGDWKSDGEDDKTWKRPGVNADIAKQKWITEKLKKRSRLFLTSGGIERTNDGVNHSPFTETLLTALSGGGLEDDVLTFDELEATMTSGRLAPEPRTGHFNRHQRDGNFLLIRKAVVSIDTRNYAQRQVDVSDYKRAKAADTFTAFEEYLNKYPQGNFRREAQARQLELADETDWEYAQLKGTPEAYTEYRRRHPDGKYVDFPDMILVQGGTFEMGDQFGDGADNEQPVHSVTVSDYYIWNHEVTNAEFVRFLNETRPSVSGEEVKLNDNLIYDLVCSSFGCGTLWTDKIIYNNGSFSVKSSYNNHPVVLVTWFGAVVFCNWKSEQLGLQKVYTINGSNVRANWSANGYRLPTEAEWEYAARSRGKEEKWAGTSTESELSKYSNDAGGRDNGDESIAPIKSFRSNDLGLYDMSGNVWEWCWDWYDSGYYASSKNSSDPKGFSSGSDRVLRGGGWFAEPGSCRAAFRYASVPTHSNSSVGFRLASSSR